MHYPKFKYHPAHGPKVVHSRDAEEKLGQDWHDTPAAFGVETCPGKTPDQEIAARRIAPKGPPKAERAERTEKKAAGAK